MSNESSSASGGIGFTGLLGVVFITLKLIGVEPVNSWPWFWVLAPVWIPILVVILVFVVVLVRK